MTSFSPSDAALEGFRLVRERPGTMLAWGGIYFVCLAIIGGIMLALLGKDMVDVIRTGGMETDPEVMARMLENNWPAFLGVLMLVVALSSVITAGVYRLVIRPEEPGFVHLRLGADEMRLTLVNLILFSLGVVLFSITASLAVVVGQFGGRLPGVLFGLISGAVLLWYGVRLLMATPMTFTERRMAIRDSWRLTRGRFWSLIGMTVLAVVFYLMVWLLFSIISTAFVALGGGAEAISNPRALSGFAIVAFIVTMVIQMILPVLQIVMIYAPLAMAYRQLHPTADPAPAGLPQT